MTEAAAIKEPEILPAAAGGTAPRETLYCSFCFKSQHQVRKLISGPASIFICDECVDLCNGIIAGQLPTSKSPSLEQLPTERLLERLGPIEATVQGKGSQLQQVVDLLRSRRVSWAVIRCCIRGSRASPPGSDLPYNKPIRRSCLALHVD